jgi:uncharacterized protein
VNQQQLKFGITCGIVGVLLSYSLSVRALPPIPLKNPPIQIPPTKLTVRGQKLPLSAQVSIGGQNIQLEVARTNEEQSMGLMYRTELAKDRGMLFVFNPPRSVKFWMKNTLIPLDMVFVSNGVVKHIGANIPPCQADPCPSYGPEAEMQIDGVIELRSGRAKELKLKIGDRLKVENTQLKDVNKYRSR